jgi:hypothetical protein
MAKLCKKEGCFNGVYGNHYCRSHQYLVSKKEKPVKEAKVKEVVSLPTDLEITQKTVNTYIRMRDKDQKCISCGKGKPEHAGHYLPQGSFSGVRYDYFNLAGQCEKCNCGEYGSPEKFREGLIKRLGLKAVEDLEMRARITKFFKWDRESLEQVRKDAKIRISQLNSKKAA